MILLYHELRRMNVQLRGHLVEGIASGDQYQPGSIDLRMAADILTYPIVAEGHKHEHPAIWDIRQPLEERPQPYVATISEAEPYRLHPGEFVNVATVEKVSVPYDHIAVIDGKSSWARVGLQIHAAGFVDPGWGMEYGEDYDGRDDRLAPAPLTLELANLGPFIILLYPGMSICQIRYMKGVGGDFRSGYGSKMFQNHYHSSTGVVGSLGGQDIPIGHDDLDDHGRFKTDEIKAIEAGRLAKIRPFIPVPIIHEMVDWVAGEEKRPAEADPQINQCPDPIDPKIDHDRCDD